MLLVVLEPYRKALETARRTHYLATDLGIPRIFGVANKIRDDGERQEVESFAQKLGLPLLAVIPYDERVREADRDGVAIIDIDPEGKTVTTVAQLLDAVEREFVAA